MKNSFKSNVTDITDNNAISKGLVRHVKVHTNLSQEVLVTTEDKIRICLIKYLNNLGKKNVWIAPMGIFLTIILTLLTTNFKEFYFSADTWTAVFIISCILSFIWLISSLRYIFISVEVDKVIDELKKGSPIKKDRDDSVFIVHDKDNKIFISSDYRNLHFHNKKVE